MKEFDKATVKILALIIAMVIVLSWVIIRNMR